MAIKYVVIPETKTTIGILENTKWDAVYRIHKMLNGTSINLCNLKNYVMPNVFKATVVCNDLDFYNVEDGKRRAKEKLMKNYHKSIDKRIDKFREEILVLNGKLFKNPEENA